MTETRMQRVLVCVDGSNRSFETVRQLCRWQEVFGAGRIVLWHSFNTVPDHCWDLEKMPGANQAAAEMRAWELENKRQIEAFMARSRQALEESGIAAERIKPVIRPRDKGIARDIIAEARTGYDLVVLRRRGASALRGLIMGSVANKLMERIDFAPLMIVGMAPPLRQVLVGVDGSEGSRRAARFAGKMACRDRFHLTLAGVSRPGTPLDGDAFDHLKASLEAIRGEIAAQGVPEKRLHVRILPDCPSRAAALADVAEKDELDTIVVGRRGWSDPNEFAIGGVARKVIELARHKTVFIIP